MKIAYCFFIGILIYLINIKVIGNENFNDNEKLRILQESIQELLNRIEIAEHEILVLKQNAFEKSKFNTKGSFNIKNSDNIDIFGIVDTMSSDDLNIQSNSEKELYNLALQFLKSKDFINSEKYFLNFIKTYPSSNLLSNALFWYADTFFQQKIFDKAALNFLKGYRTKPKGDKAADSLLKAAISLGELKNNTEVCKIIKKLESEFRDRPSRSKKIAEDAKIKYGCNIKE